MVRMMVRKKKTDISPAISGADPYKNFLSSKAPPPKNNPAYVSPVATPLEIDKKIREDTNWLLTEDPEKLKTEIKEGIKNKKRGARH